MYKRTNFSKVNEKKRKRKRKKKRVRARSAIELALKNLVKIHERILDTLG